MKWWVFILLPFHLLAQETYNDCVKIPPQTYEVNFDADKEYYWWVSNGSITVDNGNSITIQWPDSIGEYIISVYTTIFSCIGDTSYYEVLVEACPNIQLFIPNSFTPNKDSYNDVFFIKGRSADNIRYLAIYNRWGTRIFEANSNIPWNGESCPSGVYAIVVLVDNKRFVKFITLIR